MSEKLGTNLAEVGTDCISRQAIDKFVDGLEEIFADLRELHVDDSVCGLCEYDGAYIGQSGDWCNECPGFDKDDCFKLSDKTRKEWTEEIIKALPPSQPEQDWIPVSVRMPEEREWVGTKQFGTTISDEVYVTFETHNGERFTEHISFQNGKVPSFKQREIDVWHGGAVPIAWKPKPEPWKGGAE